MRRQNPNKKRIVLGLTGSFGSGKTTVSRLFCSLGAKAIDADKLAHKQIRRGSFVYKKIKREFPCTVFKRNGYIDRKKLAAIVFADKVKLARLNNIIHPGVIRDIKHRVKSLGKTVIVLDAPLLLEAGLRRMADKLIVVRIPQSLQIERIRKKSSLSSADILKRIKCQLPVSEKVRLADFIIDNTGSIEKTKSQVKKIWKGLQPPSGGYKGGSCGKTGY